MNIANNIKRRRLELGVSQQELAVALGYKSRSSIAKIENGTSDVPLSKLVPLARTLDTTIETLLTGSYDLIPADLNNPRNHGTNESRIAAMILAGGKSSRNLQNIPNQFINVLGKPVVMYCLEVYQKHPLIDDIVIVCLEGWDSIMAAYLRQYNIAKACAIVTAGESGVLSISNGLWYLIAAGYNDNDLIVLQEATRPFVTEEMVSSLLRLSRRKGSAVIGEPMNDSVQFAVSANRTDYIERDSLVSLQSPDAYTLDTLREIFAHAQEKHLTLEDNCIGMLMARLGYRLNFCDGGHGNMKIVRQEDIAVFTALLKQRS